MHALRHDDVASRGVPLVVIALLAANAAVFGREIALLVDEGDAALGAFFEAWGLVPRELLRAASQRGATQPVVWLTPLTAMFLHASLLHLAGNLLYLWIFGGAIEALLGHARFAVLYAVSGLAAAAVHVASDPHSYVATVGASGAVSGVLGAYALCAPAGRLRLAWPPVRVPAAVLLLAWIVLLLLTGLGARRGGASGVAWWAHVGGFVAGAGLGRLMCVEKPTDSRLRT